MQKFQCLVDVLRNWLKFIGAFVMSCYKED
uniref:Cytochrome P450 n=1 Tax=Triatoma infestans TaxID=30076 RepID=A0A171B6K1_TRIIF